MWNKLSRREKLLLLASGLIIAVALYYFYLYQPLNLEVEMLTKELTIKEQQLDSATVMADKLPLLKKQVGDINNYKTKDKKLLSSEDLLQILEREAKRFGIKLENFYPNEENNKVRYTILLTGSYQSFIDYLYELEQISFPLEFNSLSIQPGEDTKLDIKIVLSYLLPGMDGVKK